MSLYKNLAEFGSKFFGQDTLFKYGFNWSPMYKRSTGKIIEISEDIMNIRVKLPISYKNRNYVNSIFGGSMFSAVDPIPMIQLMQILGNDYVVWDKSAEIYFKKPAREDLYADFIYTVDEIQSIKERISKNDEIDVNKSTLLTSKDRSIVYCEVKKTIYVAEKGFYRDKIKARRK